ncbi:MAG: NAD(P)-dependent oxidoreductase [Myxococcales bacterium]|nr:NAD(P)-dependent oxidoreductase [Myxococcales bacterium]
MQQLALVTGTPGWLGSRLAQWLQAGGLDDNLPRQPGFAVRCLVQPGQDATALRQMGVEVASGDLRDPPSLHSFLRDSAGAVLFHCAGLIHPARIADLYELNFVGTQNLAAAAQIAGVRRMVYVSSNSPAGINPHRTALFDEMSEDRPFLNYGHSKRLAESVVHRIAALGVMEAVVVRPPWFYGPGQPARQTLFFQMIRAGKAPLVGDGSNLRSMGYVDNVCQGMDLCGRTAGINGRTYWIADERPYPMREIIDTVQAVLERDFGLPCSSKRLRLPHLASTVAHSLDRALQSLGLYHQKIHVLSEMDKDIACSVGRAQAELGFAPQVSLEEGMRRSIADALQRGVRI